MIMNEYLIITTKQEFTSLYRFGKIPNSSSRLINIDNADVDLERTFINLPFFEGDEEYLILKIDLADKLQPFVFTSNLIEIIPLTKLAKISLSGKFDSKINFSEPIYESIIRNVEDSIEISDKIQGAKSLTNMFFHNNTSSISEEILKKSYSLRMEAKKSNEIQADFFTHLMVYERYEFFPNTDLGYFYDLGEVFAFYKGQNSFKGSNYHSFLEKYKIELREKKLTDIIHFIEKNNEIDSFKNLLTEVGEKRYLTTVFYLKYKNELINKDSVKDTNIAKIMDWVNQNEFYIKENVNALFLLGGFVGFKKIYDDYYDSINLRIFKSIPTDKHPDSEFISGEKKKKEKTVNKESKIRLIEKVEVNEINHIESNLSETDPQSYQEDFKSDVDVTNEPPIIKSENNNSNNLNVEEVVYSETKVKLNELFKKYKKDELKLEKKILSDFVEIFTPVCGNSKPTKKSICELINSKFNADFECPKNKTVKKKNSGSLFDNKLMN